GQRTRACFRDGVVLRLAVRVGGAPGALDPPPLLEADERGIERSLVQLERLRGNLLEARRYAVRMLRPHRRQRAQDDEVERAGQQLAWGGFSTRRHSGDSMRSPFVFKVEATLGKSLALERRERVLMDREASAEPQPGSLHALAD